MNWYCGRGRVSELGEIGRSEIERTQAETEEIWTTTPMMRTMLSTTMAFLRPRRSAILGETRRISPASLPRSETNHLDSRCAKKCAEESADREEGDDEAGADVGEFAGFEGVQVGAACEATLEVVLRGHSCQLYGSAGSRVTKLAHHLQEVGDLTCLREESAVSSPPLTRSLAHLVAAPVSYLRRRGISIVVSARRKTAYAPEEESARRKDDAEGQLLSLAASSSLDFDLRLTLPSTRRRRRVRRARRWVRR